AAFDFDLGILGGGAAGLTAAAGAAQFGAKTILVEKAKKLGGDCLHFGCVPSKTLIRTAGAWSLARRAKEFGLPEIELPPVSLAAVMDRVLTSHFREVDRALAEGEIEGKIKVLISPSGALLGCQIAGHHAGELIHEWVAAINGGVKLSTLAGSIHAYPTLAEISKKAAGSYYSEKLFSDRTRKILRFLFDLKGRVCTPEGEPG
ncbi:MAG: FAD-dependent oxidoreductase, partial [Candidatus Deferrimicrobiota bacterium]